MSAARSSSQNTSPQSTSSAARLAALQLRRRPVAEICQDPVRLIRPIGQFAIAPGVQAGPLRPPAWATHSLVEDGGITHEWVSDVRPQAAAWLGELNLARGHPTEVSISVVDRPGPDGWLRAAPTVQVEGGTFSIAQAVRLRQALDELLGLVDDV